MVVMNEQECAGFRFVFVLGLRWYGAKVWSATGSPMAQQHSAACQDFELEQQWLSLRAEPFRSPALMF